MAFSLSSWFKGKPEVSDTEGEAGHTKPGKESTRVPNVPPAAPPPPPPASVRTVLPGSGPATPVSLRTPGAPSVAGARPPVTRNVVRPPARKVSFPVPSAATPHSPVAVPPPMSPPPRMAPPAPAPAPEAPDTTVSLTVGDFLDRLPSGFVAPGPLDRQRVVEFRANELYSDLAKGRASVPASTIYAKCPDIFARPVTDTEDVEVQLPLQKLVEQLSAAFQTRQDQVAEEPVGEIETPFLQVAMEDNARLPTAAGTSAGALRSSVSLPVPVFPAETEGLPQRPAHRTGQISTISSKPAIEPPPAPTFAPPSAPPINPGKRPPSTVRASVAGGKIRLSGPAAVARMVPAPTVPPPAVAKPPGSPSSSTTQRIEVPRGPAVAGGAANSPSHQVAKKTARIQIPPISLKPPTGPTSAPRPPSMPPPPAVPVQSSPVSIHPPGADRPLSFRTSPPPPPSVKLPPPSFAPPRPSFPPPSFPAIPPGAGLNVPPPAASPTPEAPPDDRRIELNLAAVLRAQPVSALAVEPEDVPDSAHFSLPFALVEKQLSTGRVSVPLATFTEALPEAHRHVLAADSGLTDVQIPLQEVFQNLPGNALTMRQDQIVEEIGDAYPTPFSQKAAEDAQRLGGTSAATPPPAAVPGAPAAEAVEFVENAAPVAEPVAEDPAMEDLAPVVEDLPAVENAPVVEAAAQELAPAQDLPTDLGEMPVADLPEPEPLPVVAEEPSAPKKRKTYGKPAPTAEDDRPLAPATGIHPPEQPVVEPPAAIDPPPVAEALAMLESTAPGEEFPAPEPKSTAPARPSVPAVASTDTELQTVFMTEEELDAKGVVRHVCLLPGVTGCAVMFADGLRLAGNFPDGDTEGFSAMAPPFFKRTGNFATEADLGKLLAITLHTDRGMLSFFMHEDICLSARHTGRGFLPGVREKLEIVTRELAKMYATEKSAETPGEYPL